MELLNKNEIDNLVYFTHFYYIPCSINKCHFPALIERKKNLIHVTCIQNHYCIYNSLYDLLLNLNKNENNICSFCKKNFNNLKEKWYCKFCEKYFHNYDDHYHIHELINYIELINICNFHLKKMEKYCEECKRGICNLCEENCKKKKHEVKTFDCFSEEKNDEEIINYFINECKFELFFYERYICLQYNNMKNQIIPVNYETFQNFKNLKEIFPKIIGKFYYNKEKWLDEKYLNDKSYLFYKILDNENFIGYKFNKELNLFNYDESRREYNKHIYNIQNFNIKKIFYDNPNLFFIDEKEYFQINKDFESQNGKFEEKIIHISNSTIALKNLRNEINLYKRNEPKKIITTIRNKPDIKFLYLYDENQILYCIKQKKQKKQNESEYTYNIVYEDEFEYEFILKDIDLPILYASTVLNFGIYKIFKYNDYLLLVLYNLNILKSKINQLNFELLISNKEIFEQNENCFDCFIFETILIFYSKEKITYYPLLNNSLLT